jgi:hypothetical protein
LVIVNIDWVPVEGRYPLVAELGELSWIVVSNGAESQSSTSSEDVLDQQQVFVLPEVGPVDLTDVPGMEFGLPASKAFKMVRFQPSLRSMDQETAINDESDQVLSFHSLKTTSRRTLWRDPRRFVSCRTGSQTSTH